MGLVRPGPAVVPCVTWELVGVPLRSILPELRNWLRVGPEGSAGIAGFGGNTLGSESRTGCRMHELSIAESILEAVRKEIADRPGTRPIRVGLRIGELTAVDVDSLTFCFEAVLKGTDWESLRLDARVCLLRRTCNDCSNEFAVVDYNVNCPTCGGGSTKLSSGDELDFDYLEVETDGTPAVKVEGAE